LGALRLYIAERAIVAVARTPDERGDDLITGIADE